ncbi:unnamed protein product [Gongylonema pulchrum]|uniref:carbonic anhydrase n=1 Tax=Gongylonema pulchrum TaxID=637853 RepID=A0A3P6RRB3_9BILA|nr:unnamed protein product [Gongylonema pulchrum]
MHLVHAKKDVEPDEENTIAVVGVFLALGNNAEPLQNLRPYIINVKNPESEKAVHGFSVHSFIPSHPENFYRYEGSLTTPSCDESVVWIVMADPISATLPQMQAFREVVFGSLKTGENQRPTQSLNGRRIQFRATNYALYNNAAAVEFGSALRRIIAIILLIAWLPNNT